MDVMIPLQIIKGMTLDTLVRDCVANLPLDSAGTYGQEGLFYLPVNELPKRFENTRFGDLLFLDKPVCALTSRRYLQRVDPEFTISALFQEEGDFFPYNPSDIKKVGR